MKITGNILIGIILLIMGFVLLAANFMGIKVNLFRLFPGTALVILGIVILFGHFGGHHEVFFDRRKVDLNEPFGEKSIIFAEGTIDLNDLNSVKLGQKLKINVVFGSGRLILNPGIPTVVQASSAFSSLQLPGQSVNFLGSTEYRTGEIKTGEPYLDIEANVVFGHLKVIKP